MKKTEYPKLVKKYLNKIVLDGGAERTAIEYGRDINLFFSFMLRLKHKKELNIKDIDINFIKKITKDDFNKFIIYIASNTNKLSDKEKPNQATTRSRKISAIKSFFKYLCEENLLENNISADIKMPKLQKRLPKYLTKEECIQLLNCIEGEHEIRDKAIITLFLTSAIRLSELVGINLKSIKDNSLNVFGKGSKERNIPLVQMCVDAINKYLEVRPNVQSDALFLSENEVRISPKAVESLVKKYLNKIGKGDLSCHKLRHACLSMLYGNGADLVEIATIAGHASIATTQIYVHINNEQIRSAINKNPLTSL